MGTSNNYLEIFNNYDFTEGGIREVDDNSLNWYYKKMKEIVDNLNEILEKKIEFKFGPRRSGDSKMIVANIDKFQNFFKWKPNFNNLKIILQSAINWEKEIK